MSEILEVKNLKKDFYKGKTSFTAVDDISFSVKKGECLGLVGESGCGKSTAAKMITLLQKLIGGSILLNGQGYSETQEESEKKISIRTYR